MTKTIEIHINVLDEAIPTLVFTQAEILDENLFKIFPTNDYDPEDEIWEFKPGSIVKCKQTKDIDGNDILLAVEKIFL